MTWWQSSLKVPNQAFPYAALLLGAALAGLALLALPVVAGEPSAAAGDEPVETEGGWAGLSTANKVFFCIAFFFSALFVWQFIMTMIGLAGSGADVEVDADVGGDVDVDADVGDVDAGGDVEADAGDTGGADAAAAEGDTALSFKLLSLRSVVAGGTLFGWAGALYLYNGTPLDTALVYALAWAFGGALIVAVLMYLMRRLQETGTPRLATCVGRPATVYMDIPESGAGKGRTMVSGAVSSVPARSAGGNALKAGTPVRVTRLVNPSTVEVEKTDE